MTTFGEALEKAWIAANAGTVENLSERGAAFLKSLEASGFKTIGPEPTLEMQDAGNKAVMAYYCSPGSGLVVEPLEIQAESFRAQHAAAPSVTDLLAEEKR